MSNALETAMQTTAKRLLSSGEVDTVLAYGQNGHAVFLRDAAKTNELRFNTGCTSHLAVYLPNLNGKTAVFAKPCDIRAMCVQVAENRVKREAVHIVGFTCPGMRDETNIPLAACGLCEHREPVLYDEILREKAEGEPVAFCAYEADSRPRAERWAQFLWELDACTLCHACKNACPGCGCPSCFFERDGAPFLGAKPGRQDKMLFHLGHALHLSGRCVACGACEGACAFGVDLSCLRHAAAHFLKTEYGFEAGLSEEAQSALLQHNNEDCDCGFHGGDGHDTL